MKRLILVICTLLVLVIPSQAYAATITETTPIFWYGRQGDFQKGFTGSIQLSNTNNDFIQTVTFNNSNFDEGTYDTVYFWQQVPAPQSNPGTSAGSTGASTNQPQYEYYTLGSTDVYGDGSQTVTCPAGTNIVCFYGSAGGQVYPAPMPWSYVSQETDSSGNTYTLPAPPTP